MNKELLEEQLKDPETWGKIFDMMNLDDKLAVTLYCCPCENSDFLRYYLKLDDTFHHILQQCFPNVYKCILGELTF